MRINFLIFILSIYLFAFTLQDEIEQGVYFYKTKQYEKALEIFDRLLINNPNNIRIKLEYARILYTIGKYDEAKKEFLEVYYKKNIPFLVKKI